MIVKYDICASNNASDLIRQVNANIQYGWQPFGSLATFVYAGEVHYRQPMIKEEKSSDNDRTDSRP